MIERRVRMWLRWRGEDMDGSNRANGETGSSSSAGAYSWYVAQRPLSRLKYVATNNGYVVLS